VIYEAAFAIQQPLYHHGFLRVEGGTLRPFQRFVYPITPHHDRPSNYRVLTTAKISDSPNLIIICLQRGLGSPVYADQYL
jgi:hypothetical protein